MQTKALFPILITGVIVSGLAPSVSTENESVPPVPAVVEPIRQPRLATLDTSRPRTRGIRLTQRNSDPPATNRLLTADEIANSVLRRYVHFDDDAVSPLQRTEPIIEAVATALKLPVLSTCQVRIEAHADGRGTAQYNHQLAQRRGEAVRRTLVQHYKIDERRLEVKSLGETQPLQPRQPNGAVNRRVEFHALGCS